MGTIEIYFLGLICHVGDEVAATHAAIVRGLKHQHDASIYFSYDQSTYPVPKDDDIVIGTPASALKAADFVKFVPSLELLCTPAHLKSGVKNKTNHTDAESFLFYPAGNRGLVLGDLYLTSAIYVRADGFHHEQCVARLTATQIDIDDNDKLSVVVNAFRQDVPANSWILVMNIGLGRKGQDHFDEYKHLTDAMLMALPKLGNRKCAQENGDLKYLAAAQQQVKALHIEAADEIECANSRFP